MNEEKKVGKATKITVGACLGFLICMFLLVVMQIFTKKILYEKMGIYNGFVAFMLNGDNAIVAPDTGVGITIDWALEYPYAKEDIYVFRSENRGMMDRYMSVINKIKGQAEWYTTDGIPIQTKLTEGAIFYEKMIGWKVQEQDYDAVITLNNNHLTCVCRDEARSLDEITASIVRFNDFLKNEDIRLMYIMVPFKIGYDKSELPLGIVDASNENADRLIGRLADNNIDYLDLRACEKEDGINHYDMFYLTDHHWRADAAVWACDKVSRELSNKYGYIYTDGLFDNNNYNEEYYKDVFLGSYGRRVTLSKASPEDFQILYPKNYMTYRLVMPEKQRDVTGSFDEVFIDHSMLEITNYYEMDAYSSYVTLRKYVAKIYNEDAANKDKKILILRDSFGNNFGPYFAQEYGTVELLDVSSFTGSIKSYIKESKPDVVLLLYNPTMIEPIDWSSYTSSKFDFR